MCSVQSHLPAGRHEQSAVPHAIASGKTQEGLGLCSYVAIQLAMSGPCVEELVQFNVQRVRAANSGHVQLGLVLVALVCAGTTENSIAYTTSTRVPGIRGMLTVACWCNHPLCNLHTHTCLRMPWPQHTTVVANLQLVSDAIPIHTASTHICSYTQLSHTSRYSDRRHSHSTTWKHHQCCTTHKHIH